MIKNIHQYRLADEFDSLDLPRLNISYMIDDYEELLKEISEDREKESESMNDKQESAAA